MNASIDDRLRDSLEFLLLPAHAQLVIRAADDDERRFRLDFLPEILDVGQGGKRRQLTQDEQRRSPQIQEGIVNVDAGTADSQKRNTQTDDSGNGFYECDVKAYESANSPTHEHDWSLLRGVMLSKIANLRPHRVDHIFQRLSRGAGVGAGRTRVNAGIDRNDFAQ